jgi:protoporphyrinogen oxidase
MVESCDILIIGGGLSGLSALSQLHEKTPNISCVLVEASSRLGGRIQTTKYTTKQGKTLKFDTGAARFCRKHRRVIKLLKTLGLSDDINNNNNQTSYYRSCIGNTDKYQQVTDYTPVDQLVNTAIQQYKRQNGSLDSIIRYSLDDVTQDYLPPADYKWVKFAYPYDAKFEEGNAGVVSKILQQHYEETFYHLTGGLSKIIKRLKSKLTNPDIRLQTRCLSVDVINDQSEPYYRVQVIKQEEIVETIYTKNLVVAIPPPSTPSNKLELSKP